MFGVPPLFAAPPACSPGTNSSARTVGGPHVLPAGDRRKLLEQEHFLQGNAIMGKEPAMQEQADVLSDMRKPKSFIVRRSMEPLQVRSKEC